MIYFMNINLTRIPYWNIWTHNWPTPKVSVFIAQLIPSIAPVSRADGFKPYWRLFSVFWTWTARINLYFKTAFAVIRITLQARAE